MRPRWNLRPIAGGLGFLVFAPAAAHGAASSWSDHQVVASRLLAATPAPDGTPRLGLHFRLAPEWHVYWKHPGDAGAPPQVSMTVAQAAKGAGAAGSAAIEPEVLYPAPQRFRLPGGLEALGYAGEVVYPLRLAAKPAAGSTIAASVDYVACAIECIPYHDELALKLPTAGGAPAVAEDELLRRWEARLPVSSESAGVEWTLRYRSAPAPEIELDLVHQPASTAGDPRDHNAAANAGRAAELFLEPAPGATFGSPERIADAKAVRFRAAVRPEVAGQPPERLRVAWTVTGASVSPVAAAGVATVPAGGTVGSGREGPHTSSATGSRMGARARAIPSAALVAMLALVPLLAALALWLVPGHPERLSLRAVPAKVLRGAGFLAAAALVWIAYRLGALLETARVAGVELSWLAVALCVQGATATRGGIRRRAWIALAVLAAAAGVWAAWPGMLSR